MLTLEEAIKHCEEVVKRLENSCKRDWMGEDDERCAKEHRQLAEWLKELKAYREILTNADKIIASEYGCVIIEGYADVIDQMNEVFKEVNADADSD